MSISLETEIVVTGRQVAARRQIAIWLFGVAALIFAMVVVGGLTRLTESGSPSRSGNR